MVQQVPDATATERSLSVGTYKVFYEEAIAHMRDGKYDTSYAILEKAVKLAGVDSRRGGEFKLWAVQALQGIGRNAQAVELLKSMKNHSDRDVRKVGAALVTIHGSEIVIGHCPKQLKSHAANSGGIASGTKSRPVSSQVAVGVLKTYSHPRV